MVFPYSEAFELFYKLQALFLFISLSILYFKNDSQKKQFFLHYLLLAAQQFQRPVDPDIPADYGLGVGTDRINLLILWKKVKIHYGSWS
jgi:hypothetical protein